MKQQIAHLFSSLCIPSCRTLGTRGSSEDKYVIPVTALKLVHEKFPLSLCTVGGMTLPGCGKGRQNFSSPSVKK